MASTTHPVKNSRIKITKFEKFLFDTSSIDFPAYFDTYSVAGAIIRSWNYFKIDDFAEKFETWSRIPTGPSYVKAIQLFNFIQWRLSGRASAFSN